LLSGGPIEEIPLPLDGIVTDLSWQAKYPVVLVDMCSWTQPSCVYRYNVVSNSMVDTGWLPPPPAYAEEIEAYEVYAPAKDGTLIPITITHLKGLQRDSNNITMLSGYGSFGVSLTPAWFGNKYSWFKRGCILAIAHLRGGGEYGEA